MENTVIADAHYFTTQKDLVNRKQRCDRLYYINKFYYYKWNRANIWLIKRQTPDLLIDTNLGVTSLSLIAKPLLAIASHIHFNHAGGIHEFDNIAIHSAEAEALRHGDCHAVCNPESG